MQTKPNQAVEPTPNSVRSCVAPTIGRGSPPALDLSPFYKNPLASRSSMSDTLYHDRERVHSQNQTPRAQTRGAGGLCPRTWEREPWHAVLWGETDHRPQPER